MNYCVLLADGASDHPCEELGGRTPLEAAHIPSLDAIARNGITGSLRTIPEGMPPGSDVGNLSVFGYNPKTSYTGRSPLEAAAMGVALAPEDVAFRCNLVTLGFDADALVMEDYSAGHISTEEAKALISTLAQELGNETFRLYPGVSYRHLLVWREGHDGMVLTPPHDISGQPVAPYLPKGEDTEPLVELMTSAQMLLKAHPVNRSREERGEKAANSIWLWGQGRAPRLEPFKERYGVEGAVISGVDLVKGIGLLAGLEFIAVPGATGYLDTNYRGKADYALDALSEKDFVYVHVEAFDEAGHLGDAKKKVEALQDFDRLLVAPLLEGLEAMGPFRVLLCPDHPTPVSLKTHVAEPVPYALWDSTRPGDAVERYTEACREEGSRHFPEGHTIMAYFLGHGRE
ncbi:MAG: cofactor-independent phosphoglycerate mutase [Nitrospinae bacterium]|nr:cofactor-independent phosphoglycerate mutase [Nitrospinota bacterium]